MPGSIPLSLFAAQAWPDPYFGFNQRELNRSMSLETNWSLYTPGVCTARQWDFVFALFATATTASEQSA